MLFSDLYKIMANKVIFVGFRGGEIAPIAPLDPPQIEGQNYRSCVFEPLHKSDHSLEVTSHRAFTKRLKC